MVELKVNLEQGAELVVVHAADLLGSFAAAKTESEALDLLLRDVKRFSEWILSKEFENADVLKLKAKEFQNGINKLEIVQRVEGLEQLGISRGVSGLFDSEKGELPEKEYEFYMEVLKTLPNDLMEEVFQLTSEQREKQPLEGVPSINEELQTVYETQIYYIQSFGEEIKQKFLETIKLTMEELESLSTYQKLLRVRQGVLAILRIYYPKRKNEIFTSPDSKFPEEQWTFKKVLRKLIEHERRHLNLVRKIVEAMEKEEINNKEQKERNGTKNGK